MDKLHYGRVAASGWLFVLVVIAVLWASDSPYWKDLKDIAAAKELTTTLAVVSVVAGLGGPPAVGLILDRLAALVLLSARRNMWSLSFNREFRKLLLEQADLAESISSPGAFHAFFYTYADSRLIDWMRRRTTNAYGCVTSSIAIISGVAVSRFLFNAYSLGVLIFCLLIVGLLFVYAYVVTRGISETGQAWVSTIGRLIVKQFKEDLCATPEGPQGASKKADSAKRSTSGSR